MYNWITALRCASNNCAVWYELQWLALCTTRLVAGGRKKMEVAWNQLDPRVRGVDGLDDIMRFDLQHFCRRMQPPDEPHYRSRSLSHVTRAAKLSSVHPGWF